MASNVIVTVVGGGKQVLDDVQTVADVKQRLSLTNYTAAVNGEVASDSTVLSDKAFVSLTLNTKGGI